MVSQAYTNRDLLVTTAGVAATDGDGVKMTRIIGSHELNTLDPFLLLDVFESDQPDDYIGGFPSHPHRGFETVTYLLAGRMRHKDSAGNEGVIEPGGVQWMTAGKGIVHSEMPEQDNGLLMGFQLWVNLPASAKMSEPAYLEFAPASVPLDQRENGTLVRVVSGTTGEGTQGPVKNCYVRPTYMDVTLPAGEKFDQQIGASDNAFVFVIEGDLIVAHTRQPLSHRNRGILGEGDLITVTAESPARFLLVAGQPLNEPIARCGPFVINTKAVVMHAFADYQRGKF